MADVCVLLLATFLASLEVVVLRLLEGGGEENEVEGFGDG
jgi:hypothetical protein